MITTDFKLIIKRKLKRRVDIDELNSIAKQLGKTRPAQSRASGGTSYQWEESEIPTVLKILQENN